MQEQEALVVAPECVSVLIVDDYQVVREGLRAMLTGDPTIKIVGEAGCAEEAIVLTDSLHPQVVLMDIRMPPGMSGIEATRSIKQAHPTTAVIILTMYDSETYVIEAVRSGAAGYLAKDTSRELLCHAVHAAIDGGMLIRSSLLRMAIQGLSFRPAPPHEDGGTMQADVLTAREREVLHVLAQGLGNKEIAGQLHLAEVTVKKYVQAIIAKLHASDRTHAAIMALRAGLIN